MTPLQAFLGICLVLVIVWFALLWCEKVFSNREPGGGALKTVAEKRKI